MQKPTPAQIAEYARQCRQGYPQITEHELRAILRARFIDGREPLAAAAAYGGLGAGVTCGAIANPIDWVLGLPLMIAGLIKLFGGDVSGVEDMINGTVRIIIKEG